MAKQRHTVEQIISKLRQAEVELTQGRSMGEVCRSLGGGRFLALRDNVRLGEDF